MFQDFHHEAGDAEGSGEEAVTAGEEAEAGAASAGAEVSPELASAFPLGSLSRLYPAQRTPGNGWISRVGCERKYGVPNGGGGGGGSFKLQCKIVGNNRPAETHPTLTALLCTVGYSVLKFPKGWCKTILPAFPTVRRFLLVAFCNVRLQNSVTQQISVKEMLPWAANLTIVQTQLFAGQWLKSGKERRKICSLPFIYILCRATKEERSRTQNFLQKEREIQPWKFLAVRLNVEWPRWVTPSG